MTAATRLGRYRVSERIGTGGVADVFVAHADDTDGWDKQVVVKCLRPHVADIAEVVEGLIGEASLAKRLQHGNIVQVFDFAVQDGLPYVVMEHVRGCTLAELGRDLSRRGERLPLEAVIHIVECVAAALAYAHRLLDDDGMPLCVVHRDVKPSNILLSRDGLVKLADFGIAKVANRDQETLPGQLKGTPAYWAPEQASGDPVDGRTDVYGLGAVMRELIESAEDADTSADPRVDDSLRAIMTDATAARPGDRVPSMRALTDRLRDWAADKRVRPSGEVVAELVRRAKRDKPAALRVALDSALLSAVKDDVTRPRPAQPTTKAPPRWRRTALAGAAVAALAAVVIVAGFGGSSAVPRNSTAPVPSTAVARTAPSAAPQAPVDASPAPQPADPPTGDQGTPRHDSVQEAPLAVAPMNPDSAAGAGDDPPQKDDAPAKPPKARKGLLKVNTLPWAEVSIDGKSWGRVPVEARLPVGRHRVELSNPAVGTKVSIVQIKSGREVQLTRWPN